MAHIIFICIFYIFSYLTFSPIGLYALWKRRFKNHILWTIALGIFFLKLIFDFFLYKDILLVDKAGLILTAVVLIFNFILYNLAFKKISISELPEKKVDIKKKVSSNAKVTSNFATDLEIESKPKPGTMIQEVNQYLNTGEIFSFYYKGTSDNDYRVRNMVVNNISEKNSYIYVRGMDIDLSASRTFRLDRMLSLKDEIDNLSKDEIEALKTFYKSCLKTKHLIENINSAIPVKNFDIPEELDINTILSNEGFIKKDGRNCQVFNASFKYLGSKTWNITTLKKKLPYLLSPINEVFISDDGCYLFVFFTYSSNIIEQLNDYDEEKFKKTKSILENLNLI